MSAPDSARWLDIEPPDSDITVERAARLIAEEGAPEIIRFNRLGMELKRASRLQRQVPSNTAVEVAAMAARWLG